MRLAQIRILRTPGIDAAFAVDLGPGLTVVSGPNASGKSSFVRAVRALLWPRLESPRPLALRARWRIGDETWLAERDDKHVAWQCEGRAAEPPPIPAEHLARCFFIGAEDLLALDDGPAAKDGELAAAIAQAMLGGYDLAAVRSLFPLRPREGRSEANALRSAQEELRRCQRAHAGLARELGERPALERRLAAARVADSERRRIESALELAEARRARRACAERLSAFPAGMELLGGGELERLGELRADLERDEHELVQVQREVEQLRDPSLERSVGSDVTTAELAELGERIEHLRGLEDERARLGREREQANRHLAALRARVGEVSADAPQDSLGPRDVAALEQFVRRADELAQRRAEYSARLEAEGPERETAPLADLLAAQSALFDWLRAVDERTLLRWRWCVGGLALLATAVATALAVLQHPAWAALGAPAVLLWVVALHGEADAVSTRRRAAREFLASGLEPPVVWEREEVEERLRELQEELTRANAEQERAVRAAELRRALDRVEREEEEDLAETRGQLQRVFGEQVCGDLALASTYAELMRFREGEERCAGIVAALGALQQELEERRSRLGVAFERFGLAAPADARAANAALMQLRERQGELRGAREKLGQLEAQARKLATRLRDGRERRARLFESVGVPDDDEQELARRSDCLPKWRAEREQLVAAQTRVDALEEELGAAVALLDEPLDELRERAELLAEQEQQRDELSRALTTLDNRVQEARVRGELEEALAEARDARQEVERLRARACRAASGLALVASIDREHGRSSRPAVLRRAQELFAAFTRHAFQLVVERGAGDGAREPTFRAIEASTGRGLALNELSSATRMQLLLAARLAFVEAEEERHGARLPLFFDEALSLSDPARFRAVAEALRVLAEAGGGRQVVYCTSDPADLARFRAVGGDVAHVDLAAVRRLSAAAEDLPPLELVPALPSPRGRAPEVWARSIGVPPLDPREPLERVHLFYVLRGDLELLKRLLDLGVETWGQLAGLREVSSPPAWLDERQAAEADAWGRVVEEVFAAWRIGRGLPVTREVLEAAGISERYFAGLAELSVELHGEAAALLRELKLRQDERTKRFKEAKREQLRAHLEKGGQLDERPRLSRDHAHARVLEALRLELERGIISPADLRSRFAWLWHLSDPRAHWGSAPALPFPEAAPQPTEA